MAQAAGSFEATRQFELIKKTVESPENKLSIKSLCALAGVPRSAYYRWLKPPVNTAHNKELQDQLDKINQLVRKTLKYTNDDDPRAIRDRMIALQRITKDTFVSGTYADSLVGRVSDGTKSSITDHGFRAVYGENTIKKIFLHTTFTQIFLQHIVIL